MSIVRDGEVKLINDCAVGELIKFRDMMQPSRAS